MPGWFTSAMLALNIAVGGAIMFTLLAVFAGQRRDALAALGQEQAKAESLLLNILPRSIADKGIVRERNARTLPERSRPGRLRPALGSDPL